MKNRCIFPSNSTSRMIAVWTVCGLMVGGSGSAYAQTDPYIDDLFDMDLEALTVSVASKRDEKVIEAPSVVSVITKDEIHRYGARNLLDILNRVPSLQYTNAAVFRNNAVSVRGQSNQIYSNRILFLINGRPFRDSFGGGLNMSLMLVFPVESISHLEVIRGPGSVLYGTNAFSSVINIITKEGKAEGEVYARATYGSEEYRSGEVGVSKGGKDWNVMLSGKILDQKGWENSLTSEFNVPGSYRQDDTGYGVMASGYYKGFNINSFLSKVDQKGLSVTFPVNQFEITRTFIDAGYRYDFYENWSASVNLTFNRLEFSTQYAKDFIAEMTLSGEIYKDLNFLVGGSYEDQGGKTAGLTTDYDRKTYSGYMQVDYKVLDWLKVVGGAQYNNPSGRQNDFSPRIATVVNINENWGLKIMYGEAFRTGYAVESFINLPTIIVGNPDIRPEKIATAEAQFFYHSSRYEGALTIYHSKVTDIIVRIGSSLGGRTYSNEGEMVFKGIELESKANLGSGWSLQGSMMYQESKDAFGVKNGTLSPNIMVKAGISYASEGGYSIGLFESFYGNPAPIRDFTSMIQELNPPATSYHLLTANININLNNVLNLDDKIPLILSIYGDNLFNEDIYYPEYNRRNINSFPSYAGRSVYATLMIKY